MDADRKKIALLLLGIVALGLFLNMFPLRTGFHYWDETVYLQHTEIIIGESPNNYNEFDFRPPMLPLLLSPVMFLTGSIPALHAFISVLSVLGVPLTYLVGKKLYGTKSGLISALIYALTPIILKVSHDILIDSILPVLWLLTAFFLLKQKESSSKIYPFLTGMSIGLAVLSKFTSLVLIPAVGFIVFYRSLQDQELLDAAEKILKSTKNWLMAASFLITVLPYMLWSYTNFGSPLSTFIKAAQVSGSAEPFLLYFANAWLLLPLPFIVGVAGIRKFDRSELNTLVFPITFILAIYLPMQFLISNREIRYLTPLVPFLSVIIGAGTAKIGGKKLVAILGVLSLLMVPISNPHRNFVQGPVNDNWNPPVEDASEWLNENTSEDIVVYTNYRYPPIAYYSKRKVVLTGSENPLDHLNSGPGIVYYSEGSPYKKPTKTNLESNSAFKKVKSFDGGVTLYRFTPK
jgi:4-amino-4-deoxy-L-arabinose transferase-like glycosyltransferase